MNQAKQAGHNRSLNGGTVKIGVCTKVTPDTDTRIKITGDGNGIDPAGVKWVISPYDMFALEEAIQTKNSQDGSVTLFSVGDKSVVKPLRTGLALGAESLTLIDDPAAIASDALGVARCLAAAAKAEEISLLFCGKQAIDDDNVQVPAMIAELLGWAQVSMVTDFSTDGGTFTATRNVGSGVQEVVTGALPVVITCDKGLNTPRYPKLPAIMKAKRKPVNKKSVADLGLSEDDVAASVQTSNFQPPPARPSGRIIEGDVADAVKELVRVLREEAKVI
jgi:electron transfer flavoprotein beta subunit